MKLTILCALIATLCAGCASNERRAPSGDALAALPADPQQKAPPRWVKAVPPYSLTLFSKAEVDLNSVRENGDGAITAWERDTYEKIQNPSTSYSYKVAEAHYLFDCAGGKFSILHVNTRRANGDLVRSQPLSDGEQQNRQDIFAHSLIGAEAELACAQAHSNWPNDARYALRIKPETPIAANSGISGMTPEQKKSIENSVRQLRQSQAASAAPAAPAFVIRAGSSACRAMRVPGTGPSTFDLCVTSGSFSHDRYAVRVAGRTVIEGIDDDTTRGIDGVFDGAALNLKCDPVNRLAGDVTVKTIEDAVDSLKTSSPNASFDERKDFALSMHSVEVGRHCVLSRMGEAKAALDIQFPE